MRTATKQSNPVADLGEPAHVLTYPISVEYVQQWKLVNAIAEVVSNAIDAVYGDPDQYSVTYDATTETLVIEDTASDGIGAGGMIFGHSTKLNDDKAVGRFGEGLKIASLKAVNDRKVRFMFVETVGYSFVPGLADHTDIPGLTIRSNSSTPKVLTWNLYPSDRESGTRVTLGIPADVADAVIARFRYLTVPGYTPPATPGVAIPDEPGRVYIGGVLVREQSDLVLGYDLALTDAKSAQNRDRTIVENHVLRGVIKRIQETELSVEDTATLVKAALDGKVSDLEQGFVHSQANTADARRRWARVRDLVLGDKDVFYRGYSTSTEAALALLDKNYEEITPNGLGHWEFRNLMSLLNVKAAPEAVTDYATRTPRTVWAKGLSKAEHAALDDAVATLRAMYGPDFIEKVRVYESTGREDYACAFQTVGFYTPQTGQIAVIRHQLNDPIALMETLFHEGAHRAAHRGLAGVTRGEYTDRSRGFEEALGALAVKAITHLAAGRSLAQAAEVTASERPDCPVRESWYQDLHAATRYVFTGPSRPKTQAVTAPHAAGLVRAALVKWANDNKVPERNMVSRFAKENFVTPARVRTLLSGFAGAHTTYTDVKDVCAPLGVDPVAVWWATAGVLSLLRGRHAGSTKWKMQTSPARANANAAINDLRERGDAELADSLEALVAGKGDPAMAWDNADWLAPITALLTAATDNHPAPDQVSDALAVTTLPAAPNVQDAWDAYLDAQ